MYELYTKPERDGKHYVSIFDYIYMLRKSLIENEDEGFGLCCNSHPEMIRKIFDCCITVQCIDHRQLWIFEHISEVMDDDWGKLDVRKLVDTVKFGIPVNGKMFKYDNIRVAVRRQNIYDESYDYWYALDAIILLEPFMPYDKCTMQWDSYQHMHDICYPVNYDRPMEFTIDAKDLDEICDMIRIPRKRKILNLDPYQMISEENFQEYEWYPNSNDDYATRD